MSHAFYEVGGLRFWQEEEIAFRDHATTALALYVSESLKKINRGWTFTRWEAPILTAVDRLSGAYTGDDVFMTADMAGKAFCLRPETTPSSYEVARRLIAIGGSYRPPLCVWQAGKSFRRELSDGATAAKLRFNEFWQAEFQCIYAADSKADYEAAVMRPMVGGIATLVCGEARVVPSERLPAYSRKTTDIEALYHGEWREMASVSLRTDFGQGCEVLEVAVGLDRLVEVRFAQ